MPFIQGIHHVTLTVSDIDASIDWYRDVLGLKPGARSQENRLDKARLRDPRSGVVVVLVTHEEPADVDGFDPRRVGLDHVSFAVSDRNALVAWQAKLDTAHVSHSGIKSGSMGDLICFRDPDGIAVELYTLS